MALKESIEYHSQISGLSDHTFTILFMLLIDYVIVFLIMFLGTVIKKPAKKEIAGPSGPQNLSEQIFGFIRSYADPIMGHAAERYYGLLVFIFLFILVGNLMGLIPGLISPTSNLSVTAAMAIMVFAAEWIMGIAAQGPIKYFAHYTGGPGIPGPLKPFMFFVEMLSDISRPLSLSFRLFGNIVAKEILLGVLIMLVVMFWPDMNSTVMLKKIIAGGIGGFAFLMRPLIIVLGVLVSFIQAGVFTLLTAIYLAGAVGAHAHDEEEHAH